MRFNKLHTHTKPKTTFGSIPVGSTFTVDGDILIKMKPIDSGYWYSNPNCLNLKDGSLSCIGNYAEVKIVEGVFEYKEIE